MKIAHTADLHLGFRQYARSNKAGINQREADVVQAFRRAIDGIIAAKVDALLIAGDLFHYARPGNLAIIEMDTQLRRFRAALPDAPVLIIGGNHDTPKVVETGSILPLFERIPGVHVAWQSVKQVRIDDAVFTMVPHYALASGAPFTPYPDAAQNILLIHAGTKGLRPTGERDGAVEFAAVDTPWTYVAMGDYHVIEQVAANAWYPGAIEYTSTNPWAESRQRPEKGWLLVELEPLTVTFQPIVTRDFRDLPPITAASVEDCDAQLAAIAPASVSGRCVRQIIEGLTRADIRRVNYKVIRVLRDAALHFQAEFRAVTRELIGVTAPDPETDQERYFREGEEPSDHGPAAGFENFEYPSRSHLSQEHETQLAAFLAALPPEEA